MVTSIVIYCLRKVEWFQPLLFNTNSSICIQLKGFKYSKWLNSSIWPTDRIQTGTTTLSQSGSGSNGNEGILHIYQSSKTGALPSHGQVSYLGHSLVVMWGGVLPLGRDAVGVFYSPSQLGCFSIGFIYCK